MALGVDPPVRPLDSRLADRTALVIVPDGVLHAVPFAALIRRETGRYLVEQHSVEISPSLAIFQRAAPPAAPRQGPSTSDERSCHRHLGVDLAMTAAPLLDAKSEAQDIATLYARRKLLVLDDATKTHFVELAPDFDVIHFAGHGVSNDEHPALSRLLLAGPDESSPSLFANEISAIWLNVYTSRRAGCVPHERRPHPARRRRAEPRATVPGGRRANRRRKLVGRGRSRQPNSLFVAFHRSLRRVSRSLMRCAKRSFARSPGLTRRLCRSVNWASFVVIGGVYALRD